MELLFLTVIALVSGTTSPQINSPSDSAPTVTPLASVSIPLTTPDNFHYIVSVTIGTPPQKFNLLIDTGSNITFVQNTSCLNGFANNTYNSYTSTTSKYYSGGSTIFYEDGSYAFGDIYSDMLTIGGLSVSTYFLVAKNVSQMFTGLPADGILGLGYMAPSGKGPQSFINSLVSSGQISAAEFSLYLEDELFPGFMNSTLILGATNMSYANTSLGYSVQIQNINLQSGKWQFFSPYIDFFNSTLQMDQYVIIDSGQNAIFAPADDYANITAILTTLGFNFSNYSFNMPCKSIADSSKLPAFYLLNNNSANYQYLQIPGYRYTVYDQGACHLRIYTSPDNNWYIGDSLFKTYFSVFSFPNSTVEFYPAAWYGMPNITEVTNIIKKKRHHHDDGLAGWKIALIVIGCIIGLAGIVAGVYFYIQRRKRFSDGGSLGKPIQEVSLHH